MSLDHIGHGAESRVAVLHERSNSLLRPSHELAGHSHTLMSRPAASVRDGIRSAPIRRQRKRNLSWEQAELASNGLYARNLKEIEEQHPILSPMQLRVCALVKAMLPNWKIGEMLGIAEKTVENHLRATRKRLGLAPGTRLNHFLGGPATDDGDVSEQQATR